MRRKQNNIVQLIYKKKISIDKKLSSFAKRKMLASFIKVVATGAFLLWNVHLSLCNVLLITILGEVWVIRLCTQRRASWFQLWILNKFQQVLFSILQDVCSFLVSVFCPPITKGNGSCKVNIGARFRGVVQVFSDVIKLTLILIEQAVIPYYPVINVRRDVGLPCMVNVSIGDR